MQDAEVKTRLVGGQAASDIVGGARDHRQPAEKDGHGCPGDARSSLTPRRKRKAGSDQRGRAISSCRWPSWARGAGNRFYLSEEMAMGRGHAAGEIDRLDGGLLPP